MTAHWKTLVVVGPNTGDSHIARLCGRHDEVFLFEPLTEAYEWLREHNDMTDPYLHIINAACGEKRELATLNVYNENGLSSSLGTMTQQAITTYSRFDLRLKSQEKVAVVRLDDYLETAGIDNINTLLIDAQGMDLTILRTMTQWLAGSKIEHIECECDGPGFRHYDDLPDNSHDGFMDFMQDYPQYEFAKIEHRVSWNPDLSWTLKL